MKSTIKMLEERIHRVVERLGALRRERDDLRDERDELRSRLHELEERGNLEKLPAVNVPARLHELENALEEAVRELRQD